VFGCLHQVMAGGVPAEGLRPCGTRRIYGGADVLDDGGEATTSKTSRSRK
jgi:hypothetical protein